jgi:uncharacterized protein (TIGR02145 family)
MHKELKSILMKIILGILFVLYSFCLLSQETIKDKSGNIYNTLKIGTQIWMTENLNVSNFRNGEPIKEITNYEEWLTANNSGKPAWCYYDFNSMNAKYGKLYNWYAVSDPRGLAPEGWHVPSDQDWNNLIKFNGSDKISTDKLKSNFGWFAWDGKSCSGNNQTGFNCLPSGALYADGEFVAIGNAANFWSNTMEDESTSWYYYIEDKEITRAWNFHFAHLSVRCIKNQ